MCIRAFFASFLSLLAPRSTPGCSGFARDDSISFLHTKSRGMWTMEKSARPLCEERACKPTIDRITKATGAARPKRRGPTPQQAGKESRMLVLSRQRDESIIIGDNVVVTVVDIRGDKVRLGIEAPKEVPVHRQEVYEAIRRENQRNARGDAAAPSGEMKPE